MHFKGIQYLAERLYQLIWLRVARFFVQLATSSLPRTRFVGDDAVARRSILTFSSPVVDGEILNWEEMEYIWRHVYKNCLGISPTSAPLLITEPLTTNQSCRRRLLEVLFESLCVPSLYPISSPILALFSTRLTSGLVVESGEGHTGIVPIIDGQPIRNAMFTSPHSGKFFTEKLKQLLAENGSNLLGHNGLDIVRDIKENHCFVSETKPIGLKMENISKNYELPDGQIITLDRELYQCPEELFSPAPRSSHRNDLPSLVKQAAFSVNGIANTRAMLENIVLAGGSTLFTGFVQRLGNELRAITPSNITPSINIFAEPDRQLVTWRGGSTLASFDNFRPFWLTKSEFDEQGPLRLDNYFH